MAEYAAGEADPSEVRSMAASIVAGQQGEIDEMEQLLDAPEATDGVDRAGRSVAVRRHSYTPCR